MFDVQKFEVRLIKHRMRNNRQPRIFSVVPAAYANGGSDRTNQKRKGAYLAFENMHNQLSWKNAWKLAMMRERRKKKKNGTFIVKRVAGMNSINITRYKYCCLVVMCTFLLS